MITQLLHWLPPETAHDVAIKLLRLFPVKNVIADINTDELSQNLMGLNFPHPLGLAAGFDKHGEVFDKLGQLGFSFVEIGSVTPRPQPGNPKPRLFRLKDQNAIVNRYGFNSKGIEHMQQCLKRYPRTCIIGVNLGKNKETENAIDDFLLGAAAFSQQADYFTLNISSPNTPGLRDLQDPITLKPIIEGLRAILGTQNLLVKLSPDMPLDLETRLVEFLVGRVEGIIISNTTMVEQGGLSGEPLKERSAAMLKRVYQITQGQLILIGCGGISSGQDAYDKLAAGADLLQLYTSFIYQGPQVIRRILLELKSLLAQEGIKDIRSLKS